MPPPPDCLTLFETHADSFFDGSGYIQDVRGSCARLFQQVAALRATVAALEGEVAGAVAASRQLQRQRANLMATLDTLRAMEGVAQVGAGVQGTAAGRAGAGWPLVPGASGVQGSTASLPPPATRRRPTRRPRARCRGCCRARAAWRWTMQGRWMCWRCCRACWTMRRCWASSASSAQAAPCTPCLPRCVPCRRRCRGPPPAIPLLRPAPQAPAGPDCGDGAGGG